MLDLFDSDAAGQKKGNILVVDDEPIVGEMLRTALEDDYEVDLAASGEDCMARLAAARPSLILMDIEMPGMDGYETCRRLKQHEQWQSIPVLFVSSHDTLEERLQAYDAGGEDFVIKPFDPEELLRKAELAIRQHEERAHLQEEKASMQQMAMSMIKNVGETGVVLQFLRNCSGCTGIPALAGKALEAMQEYGLDCNIQIRAGAGALTFTPRGPATPLEASVFDKTRDLGRIFEFKSRMIINYGHVSLLVNNMPCEDADLCGRIRDNAAYIAEGAETTAAAIVLRQEAEARAEQLRRISQRTRDAIESLREQYRKQQIDTRFILHSLTENMERAYVHLGLTEGQEQAVDGTIRTSVGEALELFEQGLDFDGQLDAVLTELKQAV